MTTCMYAHTHIPTNNSLKTKCAKKVSNATELLNTMNNTQSQQVLNRKIFFKKDYAICQHSNILINFIFIQYMILVNAQMKRWKGEQ